MLRPLSLPSNLSPRQGASHAGCAKHNNDLLSPHSARRHLGASRPYLPSHSDLDKCNNRSTQVSWHRPIHQATLRGKVIYVQPSTKCGCSIHVEPDFILVLRARHGQWMLVCMTETGDVVENVPVIDQSSFWDRLKTAFLSRKGSLRVLVARDNDRILAVDMRVVRGSRLDGLPGTDGTASAKPRPDDGKGELHMACRASNQPLLESILLRDKTDVNTLDTEQRTALFDAVDSCFEPGVRALLETPINLEAMDANGKTALDLAVSRTDSSSQFIAMLLLQKGASPVAGLGNVTQEFLSAAAEGDASAIIRLIQVDGGGVNCRDRLGYTPLHEAVSFGRVEIVELLLQFGADVNAELCLGGIHHYT